MGKIQGFLKLNTCMKKKKTDKTKIKQAIAACNQKAEAAAYYSIYD